MCIYLNWLLILASLFYLRQKNLLLHGRRLVTEEEKERLTIEMKCIVKELEPLALGMSMAILLGFLTNIYLYYEIKIIATPVHFAEIRPQVFFNLYCAVFAIIYGKSLFWIRVYQRLKELSLSEQFYKDFRKSCIIQFISVWCLALVNLLCERITN